MEGGDEKAVRRQAQAYGLQYQVSQSTWHPSSLECWELQASDFGMVKNAVFTHRNLCSGFLLCRRQPKRRIFHKIKMRFPKGKF